MLKLIVALIRNIEAALQLIKSYSPRRRDVANQELFLPIDFNFPSETEYPNGEIIYDWQYSYTPTEGNLITTLNNQILSIPIITNDPNYTPDCFCLHDNDYNYGAIYAPYTRRYRTQMILSGSAAMDNQENDDKVWLCPLSAASQAGSAEFNVCEINGILFRFIAGIYKRNHINRHLYIKLNGHLIYTQDIFYMCGNVVFNVEIELKGVTQTDRPSLMLSCLSNSTTLWHKILPYQSLAQYILPCNNTLTFEANIDYADGQPQYAKLEIIRIW